MVVMRLEQWSTFLHLKTCCEGRGVFGNDLFVVIIVSRLRTCLPWVEVDSFHSISSRWSLCRHNEFRDEEFHSNLRFGHTYVV